MGNIFSMIRKQNKFNEKYNLDGDISTSYNISEEVDRIASEYILTQDAIEMLKLKDSTYYDNLVILTQDILLKHLTPKELTFLSQRKKKGIVVDEMTKDGIVVLSKKLNNPFFPDLDGLDVKTKLKKKKNGSWCSKILCKNSTHICCNC